MAIDRRRVGGAAALLCAVWLGSAVPAETGPPDPFWEALQALCGKAFEGRMVEGTEPSDAAIGKERLVMHVRTCAPAELRIPFHVGANRSRTWVITPAPSGLRLKHDHRHEDGSEDRVTQYGGDTRAADAPLVRAFFADAHTAALIPAAAENVWTLALEPGKSFSYALRREKQGRRFRVEFDLTRAVPPPPAPWSDEQGSPPDVAKIDAAVRSFMARETIGAAHVTVVQGEKTLLERGYGASSPGSGPPDARSIFPIGSISKQFTAAAIVALAEHGRVRLDAPVGDYLPEWFAGERELKVSHLLTHTSGIADFLWLPGYRPLADDPSTPKSAFIALAAKAPRRFGPGERWAYSNTNFKALALIAERADGKPFDTVIADRVLRPAGVEGIMPCHDLPAGGFVAGYAPTGKHAPLDASRAAYAGDGGLCASAAGLADWVRKGLVARRGGKPKLAPLTEPTRLRSGQVVPYGFGISIREFLGHQMIWHGGNVDGHSALVAYAPNDDLGIVVLTNKGFLWLTELLPPWIGEAVPERAAAAGALPLGRFEDALFRFDITKDGENLRVEIDLIGPFTFVPAGPNRYVARDHPASFLIRLPSDGSRDSFELDWGEVRSYARRVPDPR